METPAETTALAPCPFCGSRADIVVTEDKFLIVGCTNRNNPLTGMLCPNPSLVVYRGQDGSWDFKWWNQRSN
jgi:hypothetical protein